MRHYPIAVRYSAKECTHLADDRVVSVGFLTQNDLNRLGATFDRHFPIANDDLFADLISQLDQIDAEPFGKGVVLMPHPKA